MITPHDLAREFADTYGLDMTEATATVLALTDQVTDTPDLYDETSGQLTDAGAHLLREQVATTIRQG